MDETPWLQRRSGNITVRPNDHRSPSQRDKARILHSAAFRRLQSKTQILTVGVNDFYRTRLTHSLEVAQIGTGLLAQLKQLPIVQKEPKLQNLLPSETLIESLCLAHDIGHPPFGHGGEVALNYMMQSHGGFEANGQTFRIITQLEPYTADVGMDLTRRTILGLIKYPAFITANQDWSPSFVDDDFIKASDWKPIKGLFLDDQKVFDWLTEPLSVQDRELFTTTESLEQTKGPFQAQKAVYKSFDCSIMEIADDIAYGVHDLEDAIAIGMVNESLWRKDVLPKLKEIDNVWSRKHAEQLTKMLFSPLHYERKNAIGALVNHLITHIEIYKMKTEFIQPLLNYNCRLHHSAEQLLQTLKSFVFTYLISDTELQALEFKGQLKLIKLFKAYLADSERLLPTPTLKEINELPDSRHRIICDFIANMSDTHATKTYDKLFL